MRYAVFLQQLSRSKKFGWLVSILLWCRRERILFFDDGMKLIGEQKIRREDIRQGWAPVNWPEGCERYQTTTPIAIGPADLKTPCELAAAWQNSGGWS